jgi:ribose 5-phosphate isomerase B
VLALGAQVVGSAVAHELVKAFLEASFSGKDNHRRRVEKIKAMEERYFLVPKSGRRGD